jgi:hypothetical protein
VTTPHAGCHTWPGCEVSGSPWHPFFPSHNAVSCARARPLSSAGRFSLRSRRQQHTTVLAEFNAVRRRNQEGDCHNGCHQSSQITDQYLSKNENFSYAWKSFLKLVGLPIPNTAIASAQQGYSAHILYSRASKQGSDLQPSVDYKRSQSFCSAHGRSNKQPFASV